eukprot:TRINITY_DN45607_c0_g1_i1.p1 TRINITY_DN45607_c0_g1~~TRINITY_DN45607_c0_g1_i1.p1  ORF type:complete len:352 (+),score=22.84 TRINITY_DN45607_c0_g1_i1:48-1103(+)
MDAFKRLYSFYLLWSGLEASATRQHHQASSRTLDDQLGPLEEAQKVLDIFYSPQYLQRENGFALSDKQLVNFGCTLFPFKRGPTTLFKADTPYEAICEGLSNEDWFCGARVNDPGGEVKQEKGPNKDTICQHIYSCSCVKRYYKGTYDKAECAKIATRQSANASYLIDYTKYREWIEAHVCPAFYEACEDKCAGSNDPDACRSESCTKGACLADFTGAHHIDPFVPYKNSRAGCWGRVLSINTQRVEGSRVLRRILKYASRAKCCYTTHENKDIEFRWLNGNQLKREAWNTRMGKALRGRRSCDQASGWQSAHKLELSPTSMHDLSFLGRLASAKAQGFNKANCENLNGYA